MADRKTSNNDPAADPLETASVILRRSQLELLRKVAGSRRLLRLGGGHGSVSEVVRDILDHAEPQLLSELAAAHAAFNKETT